MTTTEQFVQYDVVRTPAHFEVAIDTTPEAENPAGDVTGYIAFGGVKVAEGTWPAGTTHDDILADWLGRLGATVRPTGWEVPE